MLNPRAKKADKYNNVSSKAFKAMYFPDVNRQTWSHSLRGFNDDFTDGWKVVGRSFVSTT
jgi:hypothetical protein